MNIVLETQLTNKLYSYVQNDYTYTTLQCKALQRSFDSEHLL